MRRSAIFALVILTAALLQTTVFSRLLFFGVSPEILLVVVISFALIEGPLSGAVAGFSGGLFRDLLLDAPTGLTSLSYVIVGYVVGSVRPYVQSTSVLVPVIGIFSGSLAGTILYQVLLALFGRSSVPLNRQIQIVLLTAVYNTLLTPFVYPVIRRLSTFYKQERVYRW